MKPSDGPPRIRHRNPVLRGWLFLVGRLKDLWIRFDQSHSIIVYRSGEVPPEAQERWKSLKPKKKD